MPDKKLKMTFVTAGGDEAEMTLSDCKQDLNETTTKAAMQSMCDSLAFANGDGDLYESPKAAEYITTTTTPIFDVDSPSA